MNIETVNELILSLESAGELSIREQKFLKLAKAYQQLVTENVAIKAMNDCLSEELRGYESDGAFEGPKMHLLWWQVETTATDRILASTEARGVEKFALSRRELAKKSTSMIMPLALEAEAQRADDFAQQLREGAK